MTEALELGTNAEWHLAQWEDFDFALWDLKYQRALQSFRYFFTDCLDILGYVNDYRASTEEPLLHGLGWHILHWLDLPLTYRHILIKAPRDHWKTTVWTLAFPLWRALHKDPSYLISIDDTLAAEKIHRLKEIVELRPDFFNPPDASLRKLLPTKQNWRGRVGWGTEQINFANRAKIDIAGYKSSTRGPHPKLICLDDIHGETQKFSMQYAVDHYGATIRPMLVRGGYMTVVGTSFSENDLYNFLMKNPLFTEARLGYAEILPAILDEATRQVLWPEWYPYEYLMQIKDDIGNTLIFLREYQNQYITDETSLFPFKLLESNFDPTAKLLYNYQGPLTCFSGWDLAISATEGSSFTVGMTLGVDGAGMRHILNIYREQGVGYSTQWAAIQSVYARFRPVKIRIEANAYQRALPEELIRHTSLPVEPFITGSQKHSSEVGIMSLRPFFENKKFKIPRGDEASRALTDQLCHELQAFQYRAGTTGQRVESAATYTDMVMALWICDSAIRDWEIQGGWFGDMEV